MVPDFRHAVVRGEDERRLFVLIELAEELLSLLDDLVYDLDVRHIFLRMRAVGVAGGIQSKEVEKENRLIATKAGI